MTRFFYNQIFYKQHQTDIEKIKQEAANEKWIR